VRGLEIGLGRLLESQISYKLRLRSRVPVLTRGIELIDVRTDVDLDLSFVPVDYSSSTQASASSMAACIRRSTSIRHDSILSRSAS
jgi:hypothetical protein